MGAFEKEHNENWAHACHLVAETMVRDEANIVRSHVLYKIKQDVDGTKFLKARIFLHRNENRFKDNIRKDSTNALMASIRLTLAYAALSRFHIFMTNIKGACVQSGTISRQLYVRALREWHSMNSYERGHISKFSKLPYDIVDAGRQWILAVKGWLLKEAGLSRAITVSQFHVRTDTDGTIVLLLCKLSDDFLIGGEREYPKEFHHKFKTRFNVRNISAGRNRSFCGCDIIIDDEGATTATDDYWRRIRKIDLS